MSDQQEFTLGPNKMPMVENATHLGIIRTHSLKENMCANVDENIDILPCMRNHILY
jgi:hypothetical protein